jgi:uncharacterized protein (DUF4415 family)
VWALRSGNRGTRTNRKQSNMQAEGFRMAIELTIAQRDTLEFLWLVYELDIIGKQPAQFWGGPCAVKHANDLMGIGFAMCNPENEAYTCITQAGADYLGKAVTIRMPFVKPDELTTARAEIARLTAELAARDAAWSEAVKLNEAQVVNLKIDAALIETYREEISDLQAEIGVMRHNAEIDF